MRREFVLVVRSVPTVLMDSKTLYREGISRLLNNTPYRVVASVDRPEELKQKAPGEILILMGSVARLDEFRDALSDLRKRYPKAKIVVLAEDLDPSRASAAMQLDVDGYLLNTVTCEALLKSLDVVMLGKRVFSPGIRFQPFGSADAENKIKAPAKKEPLPGDETPSGEEVLSEREKQILKCLVNGDPNKVIARRFSIAEATVKVHMKAILRKIRAANRTQAAVWALDHNVISAGEETPDR